MKKLLFILSLLNTFIINAQNGFYGSYVYDQGYDTISYSYSATYDRPFVRLVNRSGNVAHLNYGIEPTENILADSTSVYLQGNPALAQTFYLSTKHNDLRSLNIVLGVHISNLNVSKCRTLQYLQVNGVRQQSFPDLSNNNALKYIYWNDNETVGPIDVTNNKKLEYLRIEVSSAITSILVDSPVLNYIQITNNSALAYISLGVPNANVGNVYLYTNALIQSEVDEVLKWCMDGGRTILNGACIVDLRFGTNSCPSDAGIGYASVLTNRGWIVLYNQCGGGGGTNPPSVITTEPTYISTNYAISGGNVTSQGDASVTGRGVCWNTSTNPTTSNSHTTDGSGVGNFTSTMTGLSAGTLYYVRAYATNSFGTSYGNQYSFTTLPSFTNPTLSTNIPSGISTNTVTSGGHITSDGGGEIIEKGVCYSTSPTPTYSGNKTNDGSGISDFISSIIGLSPNTTYYVRAYARNRILSGGFYIYALGYGQEETFTTTGSGTLPTVSTYIANTITSSSAYSGGNVSSDGGSSVTDRGVVWSGYINPTIISFPTGGNMPSGSGIGSFIAQMPNLYSGTKYYYKSYATNSFGTSYGEELNFTTTIESVPQIYGYLYNWWAAVGDINGDGTRETSIANTGWRMPTDTDWNTLSTYLGGNSVSGGALKESGTSHWASPNTGATNSSGFTAIPSGYRFYSDGTFQNLYSNATYWTDTERVDVPIRAWMRALYYNQSILNRDAFEKYSGFAIRLIKESTSLINGQTGTYIGNDGTVYSTICIGTQEWMSVPLKETKFRNGNIIPEVQSTNSTWISLTTAARCYYVP